MHGSAGQCQQKFFEAAAGDAGPNSRRFGFPDGRSTSLNTVAVECRLGWTGCNGARGRRQFRVLVRGRGLDLVSGKGLIITRESIGSIHGVGQYSIPRVGYVNNGCKILNHEEMKSYGPATLCCFLGKQGINTWNLSCCLGVRFL